MSAWRTWSALAGVLLTASAGWGQNHLIIEAPKPGECFRVEIMTSLSGNLKVTRNDKPAAVPLSATNEHLILEKVLAEDKGTARKVARHYLKAQSAGTLGSDKTERTLNPERRLIVAQRADDSLLCYSPAG